MSINQNNIIDTLAKFRSDILFDEFMGIFDKVPAHVKELLEKQYLEALAQCSVQLNIAQIDLQEEVENKAVDLINGLAYCQDDINQRLKDYGVTTGQEKLSDI